MVLVEIVELAAILYWFLLVIYVFNLFFLSIGLREVFVGILFLSTNLRETHSYSTKLHATYAINFIAFVLF